MGSLTWGVNVNMTLLYLLLLGVFVSSPVSPTSCFTSNTARQLDSDNFLGSFTDIPDVGECREICDDTAGCEYFTYYDDDLVPTYYQQCYVFSSCVTSIEIDKAITGYTGSCTCSLQVEPLDGVMVREVFAETELQCKESCLQEVGCETYTYLDTTKDCKLFKDVSSYNKTSIPGLNTGPARCSNKKGICSFSLLDNTNHMMLVDTVDSLTVRSGMLDCLVKMSLVLVGHGGMAGGWTAAGGSGFINHSITAIKPSTVLNIYFDETFGGGQVGVYANGDHFYGDLILEALPGQQGGGHKGGDGYSGGGYGYAMDGGTDGGDGMCDSSEPQSCGRGQGIDIRQLSTPHYELSPGPGGVTNGANVAGGGGGVLVNGEGTAILDVSWGMGEGYSNKAGWGFAILEIVQ